ncbi:hypothetical protein ADL22_23805 [Streptomyces sp. NRRL F-4489]|uniref:hypothetical protein n=1 Tax=Streptomyces sp. NRRL F-4489 TaxID=1609095 RepID=UPI000746CC24|nr:hypothetical protein [Streptomyces sp. NRRL F-4489]KUL36912.1 hypothetical protein ADL22_23805 [Streptomyces sp. NRRL F-4489]
MAWKNVKKRGERRPRRSRRFRVLVVAAVCGTVAAGGLVAYRAVRGGGPASRPVTVDEASRMALSRLTLYQASPVAVTLTASEGGGVVVRVKGVVDYRRHRAVGSYEVTGPAGTAGTAGAAGVSGPSGRGLIVWDSRGLGLAPEPGGVAGPPWRQAEHVPRAGWSPRAYTKDPLDAGLQLLLQLGADRPDNALLLAQSGARWLGRDRIDGRSYDRFSGPRAQGTPQGARDGGELSPLTYWIGGDGAGEGGLRRVTMRMPGLGTPATLDLTGRDAAAKIPEAPWLTG